MNTRTIGISLLPATMLALASCASAPPERDAAAWDGLELHPQKRLDAVYVRPGATFDGYTEVMIDPVDVSFDRNWNPRPASRPLYRVDTDRIKSVLADEFRKVFEQVLSEDGRFRIVTEAGPETLRIDPEIVDLYINAPDTMQQPGRILSYTVDPGDMTLRAEFRDGVTGTLLARVIDEREGFDTGRFEITNAITNLADARRILRSWATIIRDELGTLADRSPEATRQ